MFGQLFGGRGRDEGNEATGQIAGWSLAAANLTVALSFLIREGKRFASLGPEVKSRLSKFNITQKKYLMRLHYLLNPLILLVAVLHWSLSRCKSTALPEWGLLIMCGIAALGITLKFKLCPKSFVRHLYRIHTHPVLIMIMIALLVIGHLSMD